MYFDANDLNAFFNSGLDEEYTLTSGLKHRCIVLTEAEMMNFFGLETSVMKTSVICREKLSIGTTITLRNKSFTVGLVTEDHGLYITLLKGA